MFLISSVDYPIDRIPRNTIMKFRVKIRISDKSVGVNYGAMIDLIAPPGWEVYDNCLNDYIGGSEVTITK